MREDFTDALARAQSDYAFYVQCQSDPAAALAGYSLTAEEVDTLTDPERLAEALKGGRDMRLPPITIKISGTHDWVNRAAPRKKTSQLDEQISHEVESVTQADTDEERKESTLRLVQLIG